MWKTSGGPVDGADGLTVSGFIRQPQTRMLEAAFGRDKASGQVGREPNTLPKGGPTNLRNPAAGGPAVLQMRGLDDATRRPALLRQPQGSKPGLPAFSQTY